MSEHNELGREGEKQAIEFLKKSGYIILETNWVSGSNEIDIIARDKEFLVFIEVKTRSSSNVLKPEASVTRKKQKAIIRTADTYVKKNKLNLDARFDIITIVSRSNKMIIDHIQDAFYPTL